MTPERFGRTLFILSVALGMIPWFVARISSNRFRISEREIPTVREYIRNGSMLSDESRLNFSSLYMFRYIIRHHVAWFRFALIGTVAGLLVSIVPI